MNKLLKRSGTTLLLLLPFSALMAQDMDVEFTRNEPERVKLVTQIKYFNEECGMFDPLSLQLDGVVDYYFPKMFSLHAAYNLSYFGFTTFDLKTTNSDDNTIKKYKQFELGGRYFIIDRPGHKRLHITLNMQYNGTDFSGNNHYTETYTHITYPTRQILALRGGLYAMTMPVKSDWNTVSPPPANPNSTIATTGGLKATDGTILGGLDSYYTDMHCFGLYAGISSIYIINASYTQGGDYGGHKYKMWMSEFYVDAIYAPAFSFDDIQTNGKSYTIKPNTDGSFQMNSLGWRIGLNKLKPKSGSMCFSFEAGSKPGIKRHTLYFGCGMGFCITNRTKDKPEKKQ